MIGVDRLRGVRRIVGRIESWQIRRFGRSGLSIAYRAPVLVLETTGRRTGAVRRTPLAYEPVDDSYLVVGGAAGQTATPDWVLNLRSEPRAAIVVDKRTLSITATELVAAEREAAWAHLRGPFPRIDDYAAKAARTIPVFRLDLD